MPEKTLSVKLVAHTPLPQGLVATAGRLCYSAAEMDDLLEKMESGNPKRMIDQLVGMGHLSTVEHVSYTFAVEGVSRALLAQLTRHRIASFSVQSMRYVSKYSEEETFDYVMPPAIKALGDEAAEEYGRQMAIMQQWYNEWHKRLGGSGESSNEDARFVLPSAAATKLIMTMNARELMHFFSLRCCNRAQWEIRAMAWEMFRLCAKTAPELFKFAGPGCVFGRCPEGKKSCGQSKDVKANWSGITEVNACV